ncbi:MAG: hypothetical protein CM15mP73_4120 [Hyphomicrobiales bacterium]|nr:MAG: hypothetical protein CM15mP73_4120 [Hyphomicrobiales bacterium]
METLQRSSLRLAIKKRRVKGDTGKTFIGLLERRLTRLFTDLKVVPTVFAARQFINHGHVMVNGKNNMVLPTKVGDVVEVREKSRTMPMVMQSVESQKKRRTRIYKF